MIRYILLSSFISLSFALPYPELNSAWMTYKKVFGKSYNPMEEASRRIIWENNVARILKHNLEADLKLHSFKMEINHLTDKVPQEYFMMNGLKRTNRTNSSPYFSAPSDAEFPTEKDWRKEGLVTEVKNQKNCGACWAFSATGSLEGQNKKKSGKLVSLSEQNLIDCSEHNHGCEGGTMDVAFDYIKLHGIDTEESYPYLSKRQFWCYFDKEKVGATLTGYVDIPSGNEKELFKAVATVGPVSVGINAGGYGFMSYGSGIYEVDECDPQKLNHAVLIVGYGSEDGKDYWIVKNSWGPAWGEDGYIRMARNKNNMCGIATLASYPFI